MRITRLSWTAAKRAFSCRRERSSVVRYDSLLVTKTWPITTTSSRPSVIATIISTMVKPACRRARALMAGTPC
jgi:hypothetical protein